MKKKILAFLLAGGLLIGPMAQTAQAMMVNFDCWQVTYGRDPTPEEFCQASNQRPFEDRSYLGIGIQKPEGLSEVAAEVVGSETDPMKKAYLLYNWVHDNIIYDKRYNGVGEDGVQDPSTSPAWKARRGVCVQKALIFAAMCQSQHIPSYALNGSCVGPNQVPDHGRRYQLMFDDVVYDKLIDNKLGGRHAWSMFYANGGWHLADPTWGGDRWFDPEVMEFSTTHCADGQYDCAHTSEWARQDILEAFSAGVMTVQLTEDWNDVPSECWSGLEMSYSTTTRADFCDLAVALVEQHTGRTAEDIAAERGIAPRTFTDTEDREVLMAAGLGIVSGMGNGLFAPEAELTREQAAMMLQNTAGTLGWDIMTYEESGYKDVSPSHWAAQSIDWCAENKVMFGVAPGRFDGTGKYTREQAVVTAWRLYNTLESIR